MLYLSKYHPMKMKIKFKFQTFKICFLLLVLIVANKANALEETLKNYRSTRSSGIGGLLYTTGNYSEALFGNPARLSEVDSSKLTLLEVTAESNSNLITDSKKISDFKNSSSGQGAVSSTSSIIGRNEHARVQLFSGYFNPQIVEDWGIGFGIVGSVQTNLLVNYTTDIDTQTIADVGPAIGISRTLLNEALSLGINLRSIYRVGADTSISSLDFLSGKKISLKNFGKQGMGIDADIGAYYHVPLEISFMRIGTALTFSNLLQSHYNEISFRPIPNLDKRPVGNDRTANLGFRFDFPDTGIFTAPLAGIEIQNIGDTMKRNSFYKRTHMGAETRLLRYFLIRAGINQGYFTGGLGIDLPVLKIDASTYGEELAGNSGVLEDRRYILRLSFEI